MAKKPKTGRTPASGRTAAGPSEAEDEAGRAILVRVNREGWRALRMLAVENDTTLQAIAIEALNDLLRKYSKPTVIENPRLK
ncbi:MAG: ribbon-helix-helix domain-containing protein [Methylocella sp.]